jgi:hypothetical protein
MHGANCALVVRVDDNRTVSEILNFHNASYELDSQSLEPADVPAGNLPRQLPGHPFAAENNSDALRRASVCENA